MSFFARCRQRRRVGLLPLILTLTLVCLGLQPHQIWAQDAAATLAPIPSIPRHVTDQAQMLTPEQRESLEASLSIYEQTKGTQIVVLTVPTTAPEVIEQYGIRVAERWKVGRKGIADGIIIIVAKNNPPDLRRLRIEVGKGLEGAIPDATAKRIIDETIAPRFRENDYYGGLVAGIARLRSAVEGENLPAPSPTKIQQGVSKWFPVILFLLFFGVLLLTRIGGREIAHLSGNRRMRQSQYSNHNILLPAILGGLLGSSSRGGGFGGGSGGGFSGGGGDFGGGGASGDW